MTAFEAADRWVVNNYPNLSQEEKERMATAFIAGVAEGTRRKMENFEE